MKTAVGGVFLVGFIALGLVLATDFRGVTSRHAEKSVRSGRPVRALLRRDLTPEELQRRVAYQVVVERIVGLVFVLMGLFSLIAAIFPG